MKSRLLVAAVGIPLILWVILWAPFIVLNITLALLGAIGAYELMKCVNASPSWCAGIAIAVGFTLAWRQYYEILLVAYIFCFFFRAVWKAGEIKWQELATAIFCLVLIPYSFSAFLRLSDAGYHRAVLLLPLIFSFASDTGAFFAGLTLGKHKLAPKVSPKKTVEGAIGGLAGNAIGGLAFAFVMNSYLGQSVDYLMIAIVGVICSVVAQLGDLSFSLIKREFGIKDYGKLFLAHGGVLDRFDSVLFVAPVLALVMPVIL